MSVINILPSKIYNRIAAGEVVERPSSVVKELVENSIDAGATNIFIDIIKGGKASIIVRDNGSGIAKNQLKKAIMPHATSKISKLDDLYSIKSLGFRGEALASIASVSKLKITSKTANQELGAYLYTEGGEEQEIVEIGAKNGTEICVNNLFYNTPAREKFLKTDRTEEGEITSLVSKFILSNSNISFKYTADGEVILQSYGDGFESAFVSIYGTSTINDCFYIDTEKNGIRINGYIGKHHFTKSNRSYQSIFLNGRYVINQTIASSINNAYGAYLMKRQYPFYVLSISIPEETVDVNVHPNKLDVRLSNNGMVYGTIFSVISKVLDGSKEVLNIVTTNTKNSEINTSDTQSNYVIHNKSKNNGISNNETYKFDKLLFCDVGIEETVFNSDKKNAKNDKVEVDIFSENKAYLENLEKEKQSINNSCDNFQISVKIENQLNYVGQALNTFLIFDDGNDLYLVDQHAAHEKLIFDRLLLQVKDKNITIQPMLLPFLLTLNEKEYDFIDSKRQVLALLGFEIIDFGRNSFRISSIPALLSSINLENFFSDLLTDLNSLKEIKIEDVLYEKIAQKACKSAIKSGDKLSSLDIEELTHQLKGNFNLKCPHGRPIAIKITRTEIDKWFKRIV